MGQHAHLLRVGGPLEQAARRRINFEFHAARRARGIGLAALGDPVAKHVHTPDRPSSASARRRAALSSAALRAAGLLRAERIRAAAVVFANQGRRI